MNYNRVCINCMNDIQGESSICNHCGFDMSNYVVKSHELPPYIVLNGKYLLGRVIGSGGFGITYLAKDLVLGRVVAIKEFFMQGTMYRSQTQPITITGVSAVQEKMYVINADKFEKEAVILAKLDYLNGIVQVYDFFKENGTAYIVMEYLGGDTLVNYVKKHGGKLSVEETFSKLKPVMESLTQIHERGIIHRDISPDNMKFYNDNDLKLIDFGGAKLQSQSALSEMMFKKEGYTPIEMYSVDGKQGPWTDVYAMSGTFYYCITGKVPEEAAKRIDVDKLRKPSELGAAIPKKMETVIMKGLALKGQDRYQTMDEFLKALEESLGGGVTPPPRNRRILAAVLGVAVFGAVGYFVVHSEVQKRIPVIDQESIPEVLDSNTVFTSELPLVITGENLKYVDSVYLNGEEREDIEILEQTDSQMKLRFSLPEDADSMNLKFVAHAMGLFTTESEADEIKLYDSGVDAPVIEAVSKNGKTLEGEMIRIREPFTLGVEGENLQENNTIVVNGEICVTSYAEGILSAQIGQDLVDELYPNGTLDVQILGYTAEGYESGLASNEFSIEVGNGYQDNTWRNALYENSFQILDFDKGLENSQEAVERKITELYAQEVRYFRYNPDNGIALAYVVSVLEQLDDTYLILNLTQDTEMQIVYDELINACSDAGFYDRVVAMIRSKEEFDQWMTIDKVQDSLRLLFKLDDDGMTMNETIDFLSNSYIRTVSFGQDSYWYNETLRNRDDVLELNRTYIYENPDNIMEVYRLKNIDQFNEMETAVGITAFISDSLTLEDYSNSWSKYQTALALKNMGDGSSAKEYLSLLDNSGFTVMITVKDNGNEISNIAEELDNLGLHSSVLGNSEGFRNAYIGVVKTDAYGANTLIYEQGRATEQGASLEYEYSTEQGLFHLVSIGRTADDQDGAELSGEISYEGIDYSPNESGINIVVYDEENHCIIDTAWINTWDNQGNETPAISKNGSGQWIMLQGAEKKEERKQRIIEYFNQLAELQSDCLILIAVADDGSSNIDGDIFAAMQQIGITAPFGSAEGFGKSYIGIFGKDAELLTDSFVNGENDTFSDIKLSVENANFDGKDIQIVSRGNGLEDSSVQIMIDGQEMTNGIRGMHILVYNLNEDRAVNYSWIDCWDNLKFNSIDLY